MSDESIFAVALAIANPSERSAYLDQACAGRPGLRKEVEELLAAHAADNPLDRAPADLGATGGFPSSETADLPNAQPGDRIGPYKLMEQIGEGGMGTVWMAQQSDPVKRVVAIKLIKAGMDSKAVLARFEAERQALAIMDHPNIAKVLEAGAAPDGRPYFVMELVKGVPITHFCDQRKLTPRQRLELFLPVCHAIQHAHQKGIIHRDIKPSNVLIAMYDDRPVPKVIDFGVAKATGQTLTDKTLMTGFGAVVGTPEYMSPEQASFNQLDVDTRSDVYALGVLLYELLTGSPPFSKKELDKIGMLEILRVIREQEPSKPSAKLSTAQALPSIAANRSTEPKKLTGLVRGELDWIVMKALEKDRTRRYETANGFAADVQRYLAGEQVQAVPPSMGYRLRKFVRKNRGPAIAVGLVVLALVAGMVGTTLGLIEARKQEAEARRQAGIAAAETEAKDKALDIALTNAKEADEARREANLMLYDNQRTMLREAWEANEIPKLRSLLDRMRPKPGRIDPRGFETHVLDRTVHRELDCTTFQVREAGNINIMDLYAANNPAGRIRYSYTRAANLLYYSIDAIDLDTGKPLDVFTPIRGRWINQQIAPSAYIVPGNPARIFASGHIHPSDFNEINSFGLPQQELTAWDSRNGRQIARCERFIPDSELISKGWRHRFLSSQINLGQTANLDTSRVITQMIHELKTEPGAPPRYESRAQIHDMKTGHALRCLDAKPGTIERAQFSFDDKYIVTSHKQTAMGDQYLFTVWDADSGRELWSRDEKFKGFTIEGAFVAFESPNPTPNPAGYQPRTMTVYKLANGDPVTFPHEESVFFHPSAPDDIWWDDHPRFAQPKARPEKLFGTLANIGLPNATSWFNERGEVVALSSTARSIPTASGQMMRDITYVKNTSQPVQLEVFSTPKRGPYPTIRFQRDGSNEQMITIGKQWLPFVGYYLDTVDVLDLKSGQSTTSILAQPMSDKIHKQYIRWDNLIVREGTVIRPADFRLVDQLDAKPDQQFPELAVYDRVSGKMRFVRTRALRSASGLDLDLTSCRFGVSPDGNSIAVIDVTKLELQLLDSATGIPRWTIPVSRNALAISGTGGIQFAPDGSRIVLLDDGAQVIDAASGKLVRKIENLPGTPAMQFTPDGRLLLFARDGFQCVVVDTSDYTIRHRLTNAEGSRWNLHMLSNRFIVKGNSGEIEVWDLQSGTLWSRFELKTAQPMSECKVTEDGSRLFALCNDIVHIIDLRRGREVLRLPRGSTQNAPNAPITINQSHLSLSADGNELTVYTVYRSNGIIAKRVYDGRPLGDDELARATRIHEIQTRPLPPLPAADDPAFNKPPLTASDYFDLAKRLKRQGNDPKGTIGALREAIKLDPDFSTLHSDLARALQAANQVDEALKEYREAVRLAPRDIASHFQIGQILQTRNDHVGAVAAFRDALHNDTRNGLLTAGIEDFGGESWPPTRVSMYLALGVSLLEHGDLAAAEKEFREASRLDPKDQQCATNLARCLIRLGKHKEAAETVDALVKSLADDAGKHPKDSEKALQRALGLSNVGAMYLWSGESRLTEAADWSERATKLFTEYYEKWPNTPDTSKHLRWTHWNRSAALHWLGRSAEALAELDLALRYIPEAEKPGNFMLRTRYVAKSGDHKAAEARIEELLEKPPVAAHLAGFYWNASLAYALCVEAAKGDEKLQKAYGDKAMAMLRKAIAAGVDFSWFVDRDLNPIRERADFKLLAAELEKKFPPKRELAPPPREVKQ